jgi:hypothetical protein
MTAMKQSGVRTYCSEPNRGRRNWKGKPEEKAAVYANRRRIRGERGKRLLRQRGERVERSFAHMYETGGMRRTHLRGHENIGKRLLIHASAFNLGLAIRKMTGFGTPRGMQGRANAFVATILFLRFLRAGLRRSENAAKAQKPLRYVTTPHYVTPFRLAVLSPEFGLFKISKHCSASGC